MAAILTELETRALVKARIEDVRHDGSRLAEYWEWGEKFITGEMSMPDVTIITTTGTVECYEVITNNYGQAEIAAKNTQVDRRVKNDIWTFELWIIYMSKQPFYDIIYNKIEIKRFKIMDKKSEIEKDIESVVCTMGIEGMVLSEQEKENLRKILRGDITFEEHIQSIIAKAKAKGKKYEPVV